VKAGRFRFGSENLLVMAQGGVFVRAAGGGRLFLRSMQFAENVDPGFDRTGITLSR